MKIRLYAMRDNVGAYCMPPQPFRTDEAALRAAERAFASQGVRPEDFDMLRVGWFDDSTGAIEASAVSIVIPTVEDDSEAVQPNPEG